MGGGLGVNCGAGLQWFLVHLISHSGIEGPFQAVGVNSLKPHQNLVKSNESHTAEPLLPALTGSGVRVANQKAGE